MVQPQKSRRIQLQQVLEEISPELHVYFQPPESIQLSYPCIIYTVAPGKKQYASNDIYHYKQKYLVTLIYNDPDSDIPTKVESLQYCQREQHMVVQNLYHDVFQLFF